LQLTELVGTNRIDFDVDFNILTALKGWVGHAPQGRGALHNTYLIMGDRKGRPYANAGSQCLQW